MKIKDCIENKMRITRNEFKKSLEVLVCEKCKSRSDGKYCSSQCAYKTRFDYQSTYYNIVPQIMVEYFGIDDSKKEEFIDICKEMMDLYY